jgi:hypothetical protein
LQEHTMNDNSLLAVDHVSFRLYIERDVNVVKSRFISELG